MMDCDYVILGGGNRESSLKVVPEIFRRTPNTEIVEGIARAADG